MIREHHVVLGALAVHLEDAATAVGALEAPHAALVHDLQRLDQVGVVEEVQRRQVLVRDAARGADCFEQLGAQALDGDALHRAEAGAGWSRARAGLGMASRGGARWAALRRRRRSMRGRSRPRVVRPWLRRHDHAGLGPRAGSFSCTEQFSSHSCRPQQPPLPAQHARAGVATPRASHAKGLCVCRPTGVLTLVANSS